VKLKLPIISILSGVALATFSGVAQAAIVIPPTGLAPGSQYRLVFTTSGTRDAISTNIDDYNTFVTTQANQSSALTALGTTWTAIVSTFSTNALTNTSTDPSPSGVTGVPIYLVSVFVSLIPTTTCGMVPFRTRFLVTRREAVPRWVRSRPYGRVRIQMAEQGRV
jgi:hypothetical protein